MLVTARLQGPGSKAAVVAEYLPASAPSVFADLLHMTVQKV